jgi:hypothetical protein
MALLTLEAIGPDGERLAMAAGDAAGIPVGFDPEFECATFDSDDGDEAHLQRAVFGALDGIEPSWRDQLRIAE